MTHPLHRYKSSGGIEFDGWSTWTRVSLVGCLVSGLLSIYVSFGLLILIVDYGQLFSLHGLLLLGIEFALVSLFARRMWLLWVAPDVIREHGLCEQHVSSSTVARDDDTPRDAADAFDRATVA
jgi:hypothetical protein